VDKRTFLKSLFLGSAGLYLSASFSKVKASRVSKTWDGVFVLPEFNYSFHSFRPQFDASVLRAHYQVHASYVNELNLAVRKYGVNGKSAYEILTNAGSYPKDLCNASGGFLNHKLFWKMIEPARGQKPGTELTKAIEHRFGSMEDFRQQFTENTLARRENGWNWLVYSDNRLDIVFTPGNENPIMNTPQGKVVPLLCLDAWDHAYGRISKEEYIRSFWNVVNWDFVSRRYHYAHKRSNTRLVV
jgi:superoxide dismutase, Fe-Mn family